jgi:hypothetical protein
MGLKKILSAVFPWVGPVVDVIGGVLGANSSNKANETNLQIARETNQANAELAKYNWQQQLGLWNAHNEYNTPSSQMARYRDAGLNPNLIYGQGSAGNSTSLPTPATPTMQAAHVDRVPYESLFGSLGNDIAAAYNFHLQREKTESEKDLIESQAAAQRSAATLNNAKLAEVGMRVSKGWQDYDQSRQLFKYSLRSADLQNKQGLANLEDSYNRLEAWPIERAKMNATVELLRSNKVKNYAEANKLAQDILESSARITKLAAETNNLVELGRKLGIEADIASATKDEQIRLVSERLTEAVVNNNISALNYVDKYFSPDGASIYDRLYRQIGRQRSASGKEYLFPNPFNSTNHGYRGF